MSVNNFGIGGSNAHLLLKSNSKERNFSTQPNSLYLVNISGRTEESVKSIIDYVRSKSMTTNIVDFKITNVFQISSSTQFL